MAVFVTIIELRSHYLILTTYQPLVVGPAEGNRNVISEPTQDIIAPPGVSWFVLPYVEGRTVPVWVSILNNGPYAVDVLGVVNHELPDWGGRISIVGSSPIRLDSPSTPGSPRWPVRLPAHQVLDLNLLLRTGNCTATDRGATESLGGFQIRYRYAGVDRTATIQLQLPIVTQCPLPK